MTSCRLLFAGLLALLLAADGRDARDAAVALLAAVGDEGRAALRFELGADERLDWHFVPRQRAGLRVGDLDDEGRAALRVLLGSALSERGLGKVDDIVALEAVLHELESRPDRPATWRDPDEYYVSVFGDPAGAEPWGWRFEGHHLSLNFTCVGDEVAVTPSFLGANPHEVRTGPQTGLRVLAAEEDLARRLVDALDAEQRAAAVVDSDPPADVLFGPARTADVEPRGLAYGRMSAEQQGLLFELVEVYASTFRGPLAERETARARARAAELRFLWIGSTEPGRPHYYRVHGPGWVIEYDNVQNGANHSHTVWRDLERDFGRDLLAEHRAAEHATPR